MTIPHAVVVVTHHVVAPPEVLVVVPRAIAAAVAPVHQDLVAAPRTLLHDAPLAVDHHQFRDAVDLPVSWIEDASRGMSHVDET